MCGGTGSILGRLLSRQQIELVVAELAETHSTAPSCTTEKPESSPGQVCLCGWNFPSTKAGPSTPQLHDVCGRTTMYSIGPNRPLRCSIAAVPWILTATGSMGSTEARLSTMSETRSLPAATFLYLRDPARFS